MLADCDIVELPNQFNILAARTMNQNVLALPLPFQVQATEWGRESLVGAGPVKCIASGLSLRCYS